MEKNTSYRNSTPFIKILSWISVIAFGFVLFHGSMMLMNYKAERWVSEIYFNLLCGLPFFLFLTGTFIHNRKLRIPLLIFFPVFFVGYVLNLLNTYDITSIYHIQFWMGPALLGLLVTYFIHFFRKQQKKLLDFLKIFWFFCMTWTFLVPRFTFGFYAGYFFIATLIIFPFLMGIGFYNYFRSPKNNNPDKK